MSKQKREPDRPERVDDGLRHHPTLAIGEYIRGLGFTERRHVASPDQARQPVQASVAANRQIVRGRWCITARLNNTALPSDPDRGFDSLDPTARVFAAVPTCYGELPSSFWYRWATRHVLLFRTREARKLEITVAASGSGAVLILNGNTKTIASPYSSFSLGTNHGTNRLVISSPGNVDVYAFCQFLGIWADWIDQGCGAESTPNGDNNRGSGPEPGPVGGAGGLGP